MNRATLEPDKKSGVWLLKAFEQKFVKFCLPHIPHWIETYHLTYCTIGWSILAIVGGYLAKTNLNFLWLMSIAVIGQYITDLLDGAVGRLRNTGLIKWGFYMDHLLDFFFLCSILIGYWFITPYDYKYIIFLTLCVSGGYFLNTVLEFGATGKFRIATMGIGPTEIRAVFVVINTMLALSDKVYFTSLSLPLFLVSLIMLFVFVLRAQRKLWKMDIEEKEKKLIQ